MWLILWVSKAITFKEQKMFGLLLGDPIMIMAQETAMLKAKKEFQVMGQLRVGHWIYRIEDQYLEKPPFLRQNGGLLSAGRMSSRLGRCKKNFEKYAGSLSSCDGLLDLWQSPGPIWSSPSTRPSFDIPTCSNRPCTF
jgi:hypothetical protein